MIYVYIYISPNPINHRIQQVMSTNLATYMISMSKSHKFHHIPPYSTMFPGDIDLFSHGFTSHRRTWPSARTACRVGSWRSWCWPSSPRSSAPAPRGSRRRWGEMFMVCTYRCVVIYLCIYIYTYH